MTFFVILILATITHNTLAENYKIVILWPINISQKTEELIFNVTPSCFDGHKISIDYIPSVKLDDFRYLYTLKQFYADKKVLVVTGAITYLTKLLAYDFNTGLSSQYKKPVLLELLQPVPARVYLDVLSKLFSFYKLEKNTNILFILDNKWDAITVQSVAESVKSHSMVIVINEPMLTEDDVLTLHESKTKTIIALISNTNLLPFAKFIKSYGLFSIEYRWFFFETSFQNLKSEEVFKNILSQNLTLIETTEKMEIASMEDYAILSDTIDISSRYVTAMLCNKSFITSNSSGEIFVGKTGKFLLHATNIVEVVWNIFLYQGVGYKNSKKIAQLTYPANESVNLTDQLPPMSPKYKNEDILNELRLGGLSYSVFIRSPYVFMKKNVSDDASTHEKLDGLCIEVVKELCRRLNVTCNAVIGSGQATSYSNSSSRLRQWNESMRHLLLGRVHLIVGAYRIQQQRNQVADPLVTLFNFKKCILTRDPKIERDLLTYMFQFIIPQHRFVWFAHIGAIFITSIALWIADYCSPNTNNLNLWNSIPLNAFAFVLRWPLTSPDRLSSRVIVGFFHLYSILSMTFYFCNYAAQLTSKEFAPNVKDLNDVLDKMNMKYGVINNTEALLDLQFSQVEYTVNLHDNIVESNNFWNNDTQAMDEVLQNDYVIIDDNMVNQYLSHRECNLILLGESLPGEYTFYVRKASIYLEIFDKILSEMLAEGFVDKLKAKYTSNFQSRIDKCSNVTSFGKFTNILQLLNYTLVPQAMTLEQTFGIFCIAALGCVLALIIAFFESCIRAVQKCCRRCNNIQAKPQKSGAVNVENFPDSMR